MYKWLLPTISEVLAIADADIDTDLDLGLDRDRPKTEDRQVKAQQQWYGAIAALSLLWEREIAMMEPSGEIGLFLGSSLPVDISPEFSTHFSMWRFISEAQLSRSDRMRDRRSPLTPLEKGGTRSSATKTVRLLTNDPLTDEQFCALFTNRFSLVMGIGEDATGQPAFQFSFDPKVVQQVWQSLRSRVSLTGSPEMQSAIDDYFEQLKPVPPDYKTVMRFSQLCLKYQPDLADYAVNVGSQTKKPCKLLTPSSPPVASVTQNPYRFAQKSQQKSRMLGSCQGENVVKSVTNNVTNFHSSTPKRILEKLAETGEKIGEKHVLNQPPALDVELLQAIAHEVRTPLSTIRTLTRLLLKRRNLEPDIIKRLETIDRECSEQIDRFGLIFRAVELETCEKTRSLLQLTSTSLADVFSHCIPRWQKQANRRNMKLDVILPPKMPPVVTDPTMLDQVLTGAIENFISSVPGGSEVQVKVMLAGHQLKMQLHSEIKDDRWNSNSATTPALKSIGQLLMFQPETGNISLNLSTTKNLFHALGGKLIVRKRSEEGQVLTIFLPLEA